MRITQGQAKEFKEGLIWADIKEFLTARLEGVRDGLEGNTKVLDLFSDIKDTMINRGRAEEIRFLLDLPNLMVENYKAFAGEEKSDG
jgi:hypothetical protein